jgi:hypothetical protein
LTWLEASVRKAGCGLPALEAGDGAGGAGVEDRDPDVGGDVGQGGAQLRVRQHLAPEHQPAVVGVAGEVDDDVHSPSAGARGVRAGLHGRERVQERDAGGLAQDDAVLGATPPMPVTTFANRSASATA